MTPLEIVQQTSPTINQAGNRFYFDADTMAKGQELGLDGFRFYFLGRGGVLGDVIIILLIVIIVIAVLELTGHHVIMRR